MRVGPGGFLPPSVSKPDADGAGGADQFTVRVDGLEMADSMGHINGDDRATMQGDHLAELSGGDQIDSRHAEARGEDAVEGRRRTSTLNVAQQTDAYFFPRAAGDGIADQVPNGAGTAVLLHLRRQIHAFRQHHGGGMFADFFPLGGMFANILDGEVNFRNEDDISAAGDARFRRYA